MVRAIVGTGLIIAASICFLAGIVARDQAAHETSFTASKLAYLAAAGLGFIGLIFLSRAFAEEHNPDRQANARTLLDSEEETNRLGLYQDPRRLGGPAHPGRDRHPF